MEPRSASRPPAPSAWKRRGAFAGSVRLERGRRRERLRGAANVQGNRSAVFPRAGDREASVSSSARKDCEVPAAQGCREAQASGAAGSPGRPHPAAWRLPPGLPSARPPSPAGRGAVTWAGRGGAGRGGLLRRSHDVTRRRRQAGPSRWRRAPRAARPGSSGGTALAAGAGRPGSGCSSARSRGW